MATMEHALEALVNAREVIAENIGTMGGPASETDTLMELADSILEIPAGGGSDLPADWPDIKTILQNDNTPGYGGKYIQLITDHNDTISLSGGLAYRTSDGAFYQTAAASHTWDPLEDIPSDQGYNTRWVIAYTNAASAVNLQANVLWAVLDLMLNSVASISGKSLLRAFDFLDGKNLAPTLGSVTSLFQSDYSLTRPPVLDLSNVNNTASMFNACQSLASPPQLLNASGLTNMSNMFRDCYALKSAPDTLGTSNATTVGNLFNTCYALVSVPDMLDLSSATTVSDAFYRCPWVKSFKIHGLKVSLSLSASPFFTHADLLYTIQNLQSVSGQTLTLGATNLDKLSPAERAIATGKGWTLN